MGTEWRVLDWHALSGRANTITVSTATLSGRTVDLMVSSPEVRFLQRHAWSRRAIELTITASVVLDNLAAGISTAEMLTSHPGLSETAIRAAWSYAADLATERVLALPA